MITRAPTDKSAWPRIEALPANLPAPAVVRDSKYPLHARFTAGSFATGAHEYTSRVAQANQEFDGDGLLHHYAGKDARAALAAAVAMAGVEHVNPNPYTGEPTQSRTMVGIYQAAGGAFLLQPLWTSGGTNDVSYFHAIDDTRATTPDARFRFTDDRLTAVVTTDGIFRNPAFAGLFGS